MTDLHALESIVIAAPCERVYAYRLDFSRLPEYNRNVVSVRRTDGGADPGIGASYVLELRAAEATYHVTLVVVDADAPARIVDEMAAGVTSREVCTFEAIDDATRASIDLTIFCPDELDGQLEARRADPGREIRAELHEMKRILEASSDGIG